MRAFCIFYFLLGGLCLAAETVTVNAVGDIMISNQAASLVDSAGTVYPLAKVKALLADADLRVGNLESPISDTGVKFNKTYALRIPVRHAGVLTDGGFEVMTLANNHILDNGEDALRNTIHVLDGLGIQHVGAGMDIAEARKPAIFKRKGTKIGFLGYSLTFPEEFWAGKKRPGTAYGSANCLQKDIPALRSQVDILIVVFHWGIEKLPKIKSYQKRLGHLAIDLGADAVVAHHPHVLQGIELYKGRPIAYSLGNFCFGAWTKSVWDSAILKLFFSDRQFLKAEVIPILVDNYKVKMQPRPLSGADAIKSLNRLAALCDSLNTKLVVEGERGFIYGNPFSPAANSLPKKPGVK